MEAMRSAGGQFAAGAGWRSRAIALTRENLAYGAILVAAFGLRVWDLGSRALHHDEALHAYFSHELLAGSGYEHSPVLHGPLQFFGTAFAFFAAGGPGDAASRVLPALLGTGMVALALLLRERLGRVGALALAALLAFSPALLYYGRFARNDIWIAFFTLALVVCVWRYVDERRPRYLYMIGGLLALSFAAKENAFIVAAMLIGFLNLWMASDLGGQTLRKMGAEERFRPFYTLAYVPFAWLVAALWPFAPGVRQRFGLSERPPGLDLLVVIGTLSGPQFAAAIELPVEAVGVSIESAADHRLLGIPTVVVLLAGSAAAGLRWNWRVWLGCAAMFYVPYTLLYTAFFTDMEGFGSGMWESLDYWLGQHEGRRAAQPDFYYLMFLPAYELLALAFAGPALLYLALRGGGRSWALAGVSVVALLAFFGADSFEPGGFLEAVAVAGLPVGLVAAFYAVRGSPFERFMVFWAAVSIVAYSYFGEKFPWLFVHIALPFAVLAAYSVGRLSQRQVRLPEMQWRIPVAAVVAVVFAPLLVFAVWTAVRVSHSHGDVAREPLIYTQTTADVPEIADEIEVLAARSGLYEGLRIHVDRDYPWPWAWYLRDYDVTFDPITLAFEPEPGAIVIIAAVNDAQMSAFRERYDEPETFSLREWHREDYRGIGDEPNLAAAIGGFVGDLFRGSTWSNWWEFMVHRDLARSSIEGFFYVPVELRETDLEPEPPDGPEPSPTGEPTPDLEGRLIIGSPGEEPGEMRGPLGLAVDAEGNPVVVDNGNDRVQHFDAPGELLAIAGGTGGEPGQFTQPSDVAIDPEGNVWVADTWNHRVQKLAPDLTPILAYGRPTNDLINPGPDALWGPRGIAVDGQGNVLFTDTGTHRVRVISPEGEHIATFGSRGSGPGEFEEPVGIAVGSDGSVFVTDTGNARIQKFDAEYNYVTEFEMESWAPRDPRNRPHIEALPDGRLLVTDSLNGRLLLMRDDGSVQASLDMVAEVPLFFPSGVAYDAERAFVWVSDSAAGHIRRFPISDFALR